MAVLLGAWGWVVTAVVNSWTKRTTAPTIIGDIVSDSTGRYLACISALNGSLSYVYTSADYGATWTQRTSLGNRNFQKLACDNTGQKIVVCVGFSAGFIYTSTDGGATWTQRATSQNWLCITSDSTGQNLAAGVTSGYIWTSTDYGVTWTQRTGSGSRGWYALASNSTGTYLLANSVAGSAGYLYVSSNSGVTWTQVTSAGSHNWFQVCMSSTGQYMYASEGYGVNGYIWSSNNYGVTWTQLTGSTSQAWRKIACDSTGQYFYACNGLYLYRSSDYGVSYIIDNGVGYPTPAYAVASSSDGVHIALACGTSNYCWTSNNFGI